MTGLFQLPSLPDEFDEYTAQTVLPEFTPRFFVPPMLHKPQNPIMDTLKLRTPIAPVPTPLRLALPTELAPLPPIQTVPKLNDSIWTDAVKTGFARSEILSWDALRPNCSGHPVPNPFISEQDKLVFAAARYYVQPRLNDPGIEVKYVTQHELLTALKMTVLGTSSPLHTWDPVSETFVQIVAEKGTRGILLVDDKDEVVSKRFVRFYLARLALNCRGQLSITLSAVWNEYEPYQDILVSLAALCGRAEQKSPRDYVMLDPAPINLLSLLYDHLHSHMEQQSPTMLSRSVGFGGDSSVKKPARVVGEQDQYALDVSDDGTEERPDEVDSIIDSFPTFFPPNVVNVLPAAQKSLILLRAAEPDHPLLRAPPAHCIVQWFWAWDEVEAFRIFDLEPGGHFGHTLLDDKHTPTPISALQNFIDTFPKSLHPITPTLSHLTSLVFERLVQHASTLSSTLLSLFMSPAAPLQFRPHMELLHSYLLLAAPSFRSRLAAALFSDSQGYDADEAIPVSVRTIRDRAHRWPVGLSFALLERETWPPVGRGPELFLRTVIVDSFEFWVEAERRLGFAIRDLPTGPGHDQWLNPLSLDFLYMDYKPPHPLDILITPGNSLQVPAMFTYLLRIIRVEHALAAVFRMCRPAARPLFPTLTPSNKLLLHFRFIAHAFVSTLSEYVLDTAIGGNFDPFLASLSLSQPAYDGHSLGFSDVFALAKAHSALMDDVLSACLLRSSQRAAGDLLRQALELVLEFAVLVGERKTGRLEEYEAAPRLGDLAGRFRAKMRAVTKALKALLDKEPGRRPTGGVRAIAHLCESLSEWWSS
ncbi:gamma-tubulin complex, DGRIP91/SPC98 component protein [Mycena olivaceomarginata]|nr:gamma-tubulin complex, DGRIP91/SPC98 component protein [Mycena olivaceomarginata]